MYSWQTSVVLVRQPDRGVLLVRQSYGHRFFGLPGGVVEAGETAAQAAERELFEEAGVVAARLRAAGTRDLIYPGSGKRYLAHLFIAEGVTGVPAVQMPEEIESVAWYAMDDLPSPLTPSAHAVLIESGGVLI
jgi:8-oxo-dGTP diphosphatase